MKKTNKTKILKINSSFIPNTQLFLKYILSSNYQTANETIRENFIQLFIKINKHSPPRRHNKEITIT